MSPRAEQPLRLLQMERALPPSTHSLQVPVDAIGSQQLRFRAGAPDTSLPDAAGQGKEEGCGDGEDVLPNP